MTTTAQFARALKEVFSADALPKSPSYIEKGVVLGEGGFGRVVLLEKNGKEFAKKTCTSERYIEYTNYEKKALEILRRTEGHGHAHIVHLVDFVKDGEGYELIFEKYDGSLLDLLREGLDEKTLFTMISHVCMGLMHIKRCGFNHCDLKPDNILYKKIGEGYHFAICDFGNATESMDYYYKIQTRQYRCIENMLGSCFISDCDVFSFGCIIYECITGRYLVNEKDKDEYIQTILSQIGNRILKGLDFSEMPEIEEYMREPRDEIGELESVFQSELGEYKNKKLVTDLIISMIMPFPGHRITLDQILEIVYS